MKEENEPAGLVVSTEQTDTIRHENFGSTIPQMTPALWGAWNRPLTAKEMDANIQGFATMLNYIARKVSEK